MHRTRPRFTLIPALLITSLSAAVAIAVPDPELWQTGPDLESERVLASRVSEPFMTRAVRELVAFGPRMVGTPSNQASATWLAERFREWGLEVTVRRDAATSWYQPTSWEVWNQWGPEGRDRARLASTWPRTGSPSSSGDGPLSLEPGPGAVWLTSENPAADAASECAAVLYDGRPSASGWPGIGRLRGEWAVPVFGIGTEEASILRSRVESGESVRVSFSLEASTGEGEGLTVVATLPGRDRSRYVLFCGHGDSDSGGPGANDNASGAAIVLGIARSAAQAVAEGVLPTPPWDMRFAVWGAEIRSTRQYLQSMAEDPSSLQAVFNYDQSGYGTWKDALYVEPDDIPVNEGLIRLVRQVMTDHLGQPGFPEHAASIKSQGGTDSYVFQSTRDPEATLYPSVTIYTSAWDSQRAQPVTEGFPPINWFPDEEAGMITVDGDAFYHSAGDTPENTTDTEPWNMGWCARVGLLSALRLMRGQ